MDVKHQNRSGMTWVEWLVIIAILSMLVALVLPGVQQAGTYTGMMTCRNNLKQYGLALHNYHDEYNTFPPGGTGDVANGAGWQVLILPFADQAKLHDRVLETNTLPLYEAMINKTHARKIQVPYAYCPDAVELDFGEEWAQTSYSGNLGSQRTPSANGACNVFLTPGVHYESVKGAANFGDTRNPLEFSGMFSRKGDPVRIGSVVDGTSNTIHVGEIRPECHDHRKGWWHQNGMGTAHASTSVPLNNLTTCPNATNVTHPDCTSTNNWNFSWGFRSHHKGGAHFLFADGSVKFLSESIDYKVYQALGGRADGRSVEYFDKEAPAR